jgi:uncharacterized protein YndB with AHSA1/START domain
MDGFHVARQIEIDAPIEDVWAALATAERMLLWLAPAVPDGELRPGDNGKLAIHMPWAAIDFLRIDAADPPHRLRLYNLPDETRTITYTLAEEAGQTRVTIEVNDALPGGDSSPDRRELSGLGWDMTLPNLKAAVEGAPLPAPFAATGPLFGYWRQFGNSYGLERSIVIDAPREAVWDALVDPAHIQAWFSPTTPWRRSALEVGGRIFVTNEETGEEMYVQVFETLDPPREYAARTLPETADSPTYVTRYLLTEGSGGTRLTLIYTGYQPSDDGHHWAEMEQTTYGFGLMLQNIKAHLEGTPLPMPGGF